MNKFTVHSGIAVALDRANIDTDAIIPKQFLKSIKRTGFGPNLFDEWRYTDVGVPDADNSHRPLNQGFVLNQARYKGASVLVSRENFGCGSSREHAPWALVDYGFKAILAPSYADIFYNNSFKNGLLPIVVSDQVISRIMAYIESTPGAEIDIDLQQQKLTAGDEVVNFECDAHKKECLLQGLDDIALTLKKEAQIRNYEQARMVSKPWLYGKI